MIAWAIAHPLYLYGTLNLATIALAASRNQQHARGIAWHLTLPIRLAIAALVVVWLITLVQRWRREDATTLGYTPTWRETLERVWSV